MEQIYQKIKERQSNFSKGFKKIANYFYQDPQVFAINSAKQAGILIGVSETTIIRFAYELGYSGFSALQQEVQEQFFNKSSLSVYLDSKTRDNEEDFLIKDLIMHDIGIIQKTLNQIQEKDLENAVSKLLSSDFILTCGVQTSFAFASWFASALDLVKGNSRLYQPNIDNALLRVNELTNQSVVVAFSFHRYAIETIQISKLAKQKGAYVIAFTDSPFAPITEYTDLILPVQLHVTSTLDVAPVVFTLMNSIISSVSLKDPESFQQRIKWFDSIKTDKLFVKDLARNVTNEDDYK